MNERSVLIEAERGTYPIAWMCQQLRVPRSSFYAWRDRDGQVTATQARRDELSEQIERVFTKQRGTAGCRRVAAELNDEGYPCSVGLVASLMREKSLAAIQPRAWKRTTIADHHAPVFPDLLDRNFAPEAGDVGERRVGDI